jgi:hypothetical protein
MSITFSGTDAARPHPRLPEFPAPVDLPWEHPAHLNLCNSNALALLGLLGLDVDYCGSCSVADARRAVMRARATFDRKAGAFERPAVVTYGAPRVDADGAVELRPFRSASMGLDADGLRRRLEHFAKTVEVLAELGATHVCWG